MKTKTETFDVIVPTIDGQDVAETVTIDVVLEFDQELGEWLLTPESLRKIDDTKARRMGLMLPDEIKALRERFRLSQAQISALLEIGEKTWSRWENGRHRPSRSMNLLLRALDEGRLGASDLLTMAQGKPQWAAIIPKPCQPSRLITTPHPGCEHDSLCPSYSADSQEFAMTEEMVA